MLLPMDAGVPHRIECEQCGAPPVAGLVACPYCEASYPGAPGQHVDCPGCGADNHPTSLRCARCSASLMQTCVFCARPSALALVACGHCGETFAGAAARKAEREAQQRRQQAMNVAATGLTALGAVATSSTGQRILGQLFDSVKDELLKD